MPLADGDDYTPKVHDPATWFREALDRDRRFLGFGGSGAYIMADGSIQARRLVQVFASITPGIRRDDPALVELAEKTAAAWTAEQNTDAHLPDSAG